MQRRPQAPADATTGVSNLTPLSSHEIGNSVYVGPDTRASGELLACPRRVRPREVHGDLVALKNNLVDGFTLGKQAGQERALG